MKKETIGFILIFALLIVWMWINSPSVKQPVEQTKAKQEQTKDSVITEKLEHRPAQKPIQEDNLGKFFINKTKGVERFIRIETDNYIAVLSSKGGVIKKWELKNYKTWDNHPVQLINDDEGGDFTLLLATTDGKVINTKDLFFDFQSTSNYIKLSNDMETEVVFTLLSSNGGKIIKKIKFKNNIYGFEAEIRLVNLKDVIANYQYEIAWEDGIRYVEHNSVDESDFACAYMYAGNELTEIDASNIGEKIQKEISGSIDWIATRNKYFSVAMIPTNMKCEGAYVEGNRKALKDEGVSESYNIALRIPYSGSYDEVGTIQVFLGPLHHGTLSDYNVGLEKMMSLGWAWIVRPIAEYIMLPLFMAIHYVIPNWGIVIIIFSLIIKFALHPLSKSQLKSMRKMQKLQPMIEEIREKYKGDAQKMNRAMMNLYKEYGVNPAGGCLPLLLQLPIMYALWSLLRGAIELRQAEFVLWITDLSVPDVIYRLPGKIFGIQDISGIALLMGITMFISQKLTIKDPRQKLMVWLMPIMMTLLFNGFPSGLNLYYAVYNILAIGEQLLYNKKDDEPLRKVEQPKKSHGGIFKFAKDIPRLKK